MGSMATLAAMLMAALSQGREPVRKTARINSLSNLGKAVRNVFVSLSVRQRRIVERGETLLEQRAGCPVDNASHVCYHRHGQAARNGDNDVGDG